MHDTTRRRYGWIVEEQRLVGLPLTFIVILLFMGLVLHTLAPRASSHFQSSHHGTEIALYLPSGDEKGLESGTQTKWACNDENDAICWIHYYANKYDQDPDLVTRIAIAESNLNPKAVGYNTNGTKDAGLMQLNDIHGISMECRLDIHCNLEHAMKMMQTAGTTPWYSSKHKWYEP